MGSGRSWVALAALLVAAVAAAGAGLGAERPASGRGGAKKPVEVKLGYFANVTHAQGVLGVASGEFERALAPDAKLTTRTFNAGPSLIEALFAGEIDIGYVGPSPALAAHIQSRGQGIRVIAGAAANGVAIVAAPKSGIEKLEDLKGKRIATPQLGNTQDVSARHFLVKRLGQENADNVIPVPNADQASMMQRGQIDAAWAVEPWAARLVAETGGRIIAEEKDLWPEKEFVLTVVIVSPKFLEKHPDLVERMLEVHCAWTDRLAEDAPKHAAELAEGLEKLTGKKLSEEVITSALSRVKFTTEPLPDTLETFARWAYELGFTRTVPNVSSMIETGPLRSVRQPAAGANP